MIKRILIYSLLAIGGLWFLSPQIAAGSGSSETTGAEPRHSLDPVVLAGVAAMLIIAKLSGEIFERFRQPAVLGELISGIFIGNLSLLGVTMAEPLETDIVINALAELGVIILLFEVGIESNLGEMLEVGWSSLLVAVAGVVTPFFLGQLAMHVASIPGNLSGLVQVDEFDASQANFTPPAPGSLEEILTAHDSSLRVAQDYLGGVVEQTA